MTKTAAVGVLSLTVERQASPQAVATAVPLFGWVLDPGFVQVEYEIRVFADGQDIWSTGWVKGTESVDIAYGGPPLGSDTAYGWSVRARAADGRTVGASSGFRTSLLRSEDWRAQWLVPEQIPTVHESYSIPEIVAGTATPTGEPIERLHPPLRVRQRVRLRELPAHARLYATARGIYTAEINTRPVGDEVLAPGYDSYAARCSFQSYDVTALLRAGENVIGMTVADGWYAGRVGITGSSAPYGDELAVLWQLSVEYPDGRRDLHASGDGPAVSLRGERDYADLFIGERFDARREDGEWTQPGAEDVGWDAAATRRLEASRLVPFSGEPIRRTAELNGTMTRLSDREYLVDVGQVIAGRMRVTLRAGRGVRITLDHAEVLNEDGTFFDNIVGPNKDQRDIYIAAGAGEEYYEPAFSFHGFRFARVTGSAPFELDAATGVVIGSDLPVTSALRTSDPRIDRLHENVVWSQRGNFLGIPTDCPQRERAGWTGDVQVYAPAASSNMDVRTFLERWLANCRADQTVEGIVPQVVPVIPTMTDPDMVGNPDAVIAAAGWSDAIVLVPWTLYERYADVRVLAENYDAMRSWIEYQHREAAARIPHRVAQESPDTDRLARHRIMWNTGGQFGDWLAPSEEREGLDPVERTRPCLRSEMAAAMFHAHSTEIVSRVAQVLGRADDARRFVERAGRIRDAFAAEYVDPAGALPEQRQGLYVLALAFGLIPEAQVPGARQRLVRLIHSADDHLDTGFLSTPHLLDVLWEAGEHDLVRRLLWQDTAPSWLYAVDRGATTVWESWEAITPDGNPTRSSFNHYAFGCVDDWIIRRIGGIEAASPGYRDILIAPDVDGPISSAECRIETVRGAVRVAWQRDETGVEWEAEIPSGARARVEIGGRGIVLPPGRHRSRRR